ncbi:MAG: amidinotransferase, partial [Blastocatellia bacterium]
MNLPFPSSCPVNSHNEWDPLEEVIVGSLTRAVFPEWATINEVTVPPGEWAQIEQRVGGKGILYPPHLVEKAGQERQEFIHILESEGVTVRQIDTVNYQAPFSTPDWHMGSGFCGANPRDPFMVVGNEIIETPMADRSRYFEAWAYRSLFREYFRAGARWTAAPKPQLTDSLYKTPHQRQQPDESGRFIVTEFEPGFDAADAVRCGRDIFIQQSNVTNRLGIMWLQRHLGEGYRVHEIINRSPEAIHIDTTFMPLAPGRVLINPEWIDVKELPPVLKNWEILIAPDPVPNADPIKVVSEWISINVLMLDEERVLVEKRQ